MYFSRVLPLATIVLAALVFPAHAADTTNLTIYSTAAPGSVSPDMYRPMPDGQGGGWMYGNQIPGYALIHQQREVELKAGVNQLNFTDVAAFIDPTTVSFKSLTDPFGTWVVEQDYHFDLVSNQKLLERFLGQEITVDQDRGGASSSITGKLLSAAGGLVLQDTSGKLISINNYTDIKFPQLPGGLITKPTLQWSINTQKPGKHQTETSYQTTGITWWADYNATYKDGKDENSGSLDLGAWVSIVNKSGASFDNAGLKLVAGGVHRAPVAQPMMMEKQKSAMVADLASAAPAGFAEKAFFEFHLYTLGRPTTIPNNSTKQIELFPAVASVPVEKIYVYYGAPQLVYYGSLNSSQDLGMPMNKKVDVYLKFKNDKKAALGMPLPAGRVRVSKLDSADGSLEFIGEDTINHTPKDETVLIKLGDAFDVVGERKQVDFRIDAARHVIEETVEVSVSNHKASDVNVLVKENMFRALQWEIVKADAKYEKQDAGTIHFPIAVKKDGTTKLQYTVRYTW